MKKFILASASPRRKDILLKAGYSFNIITSDKENNDFTLLPEELAVKNATIKAMDVFKKVCDENAVVLGADTVVALGKEVFGKPEDETDAERIIKRLSGKTHKVITGYAIVSGKGSEYGYEITEVEFNRLSDEKIKEYIKDGSCMDKAGAYGIQDGYGLVKGYKGDYNNVVGLPIDRIKGKLEEFLR